MSGSRFSYHDGYANLAAAIISSGERSHDTRFLESDWCDTLKEICRLDDTMHGDDSPFRGKIARQNGMYSGGHSE